MSYPITDRQQMLNCVDDCLMFAFQPIVNSNTGSCYAVEALLRGYQGCGFQQISDVFNCAWELGCLNELDRLLRRKAIYAFKALSHHAHIKLFYNLDGRIFESDDEAPDWSLDCLKECEIEPSQLVFELSEHYNNSDAHYFSSHIQSVRERGIHVAIDDFGRGFSDLRMLYDHQAEYLKIDRFFVDGIARSNKKRLFVSSIVNLAHVLGLRVVAEGIETEEDYMECRAIGCDLIQGYLIAKPTTEHARLSLSYSHIDVILVSDRRSSRGAIMDILDWVDPVCPVGVDMDIQSILERFRNKPELSFLPVVDQHGVPLGIVREKDFKSYLYGQFGWDLLNNKNVASSIRSFIASCPVSDVGAPIKKLLEIFSVAEKADGIVVTENGRYKGFLSSDALVRILSTVNLAEARDQNPLTGLAGNNLINDHIASLLRSGCISTVVYFDFNDFKPFNDVYGFRQGDRAIIMFAEILRKSFGAQEGVFIGHVGGDDFFIAFYNERVETITREIEAVVSDFSQSIESLYSEIDRKRGALMAEDRQGQMQAFPLLTTAAAIIEIDGAAGVGLDVIGRRIAKAKKQSKKKRHRFYVETIKTKDQQAFFCKDQYLKAMKENVTKM